MENTQYNPEQHTSFTVQQPQPVRKKHIARWLTVAVLVLAVGAVSLFWAVRNGTDTVQAATVATVEVTDNGFSPQTIKVKKGESIIWTNRDSVPHQIMAGPFPTGESLPGLNSTEPLVKGDSYTATFDKAGTYTYHDLLNPAALNGVVIVE